MSFPDLPESPIDTAVYVVFDGPPGPEGGRFVEVEDGSGASVGVGEWRERGNGQWVLRIPDRAESDGVWTFRMANLVARLVDEGYVRRDRKQELLQRARNLERGFGFVTDAELRSEAAEKELME